MVVGVLTLRLALPASQSLKDKRRILQSLMAKVRREFNVSVAEIDQNDTWQSAVLGMASVSNDAEYTRNLLLRVVQTLEEERRDTQVLDYQIEML